MLNDLPTGLAKSFNPEQGSIPSRCLPVSVIHRWVTNVCPYYFTLSDERGQIHAQKTAGENHIEVSTGCQVSTNLHFEFFDLFGHNPLFSQ